MEKIKNSQLAIIEKGNYEEIENLLTQIRDIDNGDILIPLAKRKDICIKLIENEKLPETCISEFIKDCSFEEFILILSRSREYLTTRMLRDCCTKTEYLKQIIQSNNTEHILYITSGTILPLNIQIDILISGNDELIRLFFEHNDYIDEEIQKIIIFSKNKKWYQWATCRNQMFIQANSEFEDKIIQSNDEEIINFAIKVCRFDHPMKFIELGNPKVTENLVRSFYDDDVANWIISNKREDLLSIMIEEHFDDENFSPKILFKFNKHKFMQQYIEKLQNFVAGLPKKDQERWYFTRTKELEQILKYYDIPYKVRDQDYISLIL